MINIGGTYDLAEQLPSNREFGHFLVARLSQFPREFGVNLALLLYQALSEIDVNASLQSDDKSLTTAHEYNKSRIFSTRKSVLSWSRFGVNLASVCTRGAEHVDGSGVETWGV